MRVRVRVGGEEDDDAGATGGNSGVRLLASRRLCMLGLASPSPSPPWSSNAGS